MWVWLLFPLLALAQEKADLTSINKLEESLPTYEEMENSSEVVQRLQQNKYRPPGRFVPLSEIVKSGTEIGAINEGTLLYPIENKETKLTTKHFYARFYRLQDERGYRYLQNKDGTCTFKVLGDDIESIKHETALYVPPLQYSPKVPTNVIKEEYDQKLHLIPEFTFFAGVVNGSYMKDLFNNNDAAKGFSTQYGAHLFTQWDLPVKTGLVLHYEKTIYQHSEGQIIYSAFSLGPQFKSRDIEFLKTPWRFQAQFRISPFASAIAQTDSGDSQFRFNSGDFLLSMEHPIKNRLGEFVIGPFIQTQWLNLKAQTEAVQIQASNQTNKTFGFFLAQVFE